MDDPLRGPQNGDRYIGVREWERARREDQRELERRAAEAAANVEARLMKLLNDHGQAADRAHQAQDDRSTRLALGLDGIQSIIDQQRGAKNLVIVVGVGTILNIALNVLTIWAGK